MDPNRFFKQNEAFEWMSEWGGFFCNLDHFLPCQKTAKQE